MNIDQVCDGEQAIGVLAGADPDVNIDIPDLVLLELPLPKVDGWLVLSGILGDLALCNIPMVARSSSAAEACKRRALEMVRAYRRKPYSFAAFFPKYESFLINFFPKAINWHRGRPSEEY